MRSSLFVLACCAPFATAGAQTVTVTMRTIGAPVALASVSGRAPVSAGLPANAIQPLPAQFVAADGGANAQTSIVTTADNAGVWAWVDDSVSYSGSGTVTGMAATGANTYVFDLRATAPTPVTLVGDHFTTGAAGQPLPLIEVDFGNNGSIEHFATNAVAATQQVVLGTQPFPVRVRTQAAVTATGFALTTNWTRLGVVPQNAIQLRTAGAGCIAAPFSAQPSFVGRGIRVRLQSSVGGDLPFLVFGLSLRPTLLPPRDGIPCLGLPSIDAVVPAAMLDLPLPPAVRPVRFWTQGVVLRPSVGPFVTDAVEVTAQ